MVTNDDLVLMFLLPKEKEPLRLSVAQTGFLYIKSD